MNPDTRSIRIQLINIFRSFTKLPNQKPIYKVFFFLIFMLKFVLSFGEKEDYCVISFVCACEFFTPDVLDDILQPDLVR